MSRNLFAPTRYKVQISGSIGWADLKQRTVSYETVIFATRKEAEQAAKDLNPGEYTQGRIRVVPKDLPEDYDVYPVAERKSENPKSAG
jgi:hypothetical protein